MMQENGTFFPTHSYSIFIPPTVNHDTSKESNASKKKRIPNGNTLIVSLRAYSKDGANGKVDDRCNELNQMDINQKVTSRKGVNQKVINQKDSNVGAFTSLRSIGSIGSMNENKNTSFEKNEVKKIDSNSVQTSQLPNSYCPYHWSVDISLHGMNGYYRLMINDKVFHSISKNQIAGPDQLYKLLSNALSRESAETWFTIEYIDLEEANVVINDIVESRNETHLQHVTPISKRKTTSVSKQDSAVGSNSQNRIHKKLKLQEIPSFWGERELLLLKLYYNGEFTTLSFEFYLHWHEDGRVPLNTSSFSNHSTSSDLIHIDQVSKIIPVEESESNEIISQDNSITQANVPNDSIEDAVQDGLQKEHSQNRQSNSNVNQIFDKVKEIPQPPKLNTSTKSVHESIRITKSPFKDRASISNIERESSIVEDISTITPVNQIEYSPSAIFESMFKNLEETVTKVDRNLQSKIDIMNERINRLELQLSNNSSNILQEMKENLGAELKVEISNQIEQFSSSHDGNIKKILWLLQRVQEDVQQQKEEHNSISSELDATQEELASQAITLKNMNITIDAINSRLDEEKLSMKELAEKFLEMKRNQEILQAENESLRTFLKTKIEESVKHTLQELAEKQLQSSAPVSSIGEPHESFAESSLITDRSARGPYNTKPIFGEQPSRAQVYNSSGETYFAPQFRRAEEYRQQPPIPRLSLPNSERTTPYLAQYQNKIQSKRSNAVKR